MANINRLTQDAARYLGDRPKGRDIFLENAVRRIADLHTQDRLDAKAIARRLRDAYGSDSPFRRIDFIQFVIDRI
ncbi:hypothetical protein [Amycolatopsis sp. NPDC102389]|uniref:hypothetical protein n=1 Tax=Amycolatopsis sp. NPDC102389 TaxID=3363941 RepID=UPI00380E1DCB